MNSEKDHQWETTLDRELKSLPELVAPGLLKSRVLCALEQMALPWYRRSWDQWPVWLRMVSFAVLAALFAFLCFSTQQVLQSNVGMAVKNQFGAWLADASLLWRTTDTLTGAAGAALRGMGPLFLVACIAGGVLAYGLCVGMTTVYVRFGLALGQTSDPGDSRGLKVSASQPSAADSQTFGGR